MKTQLKQRRQGDISGLPQELPALLRQIYAARGITQAQQLEKKLSGLLPPSQLKDIDKACLLLTQALEQQQKITIVGDFDCDGATSTTLMIKSLRAMGAAQVDYLVPNRFSDGYGLSPAIVAVAEKQKTELLITVDNGISCFAGVDAAKAAGMQVIITDHHLAGSALPNADAIVNPNQPECTFASKAIAGVGVAFYVMLALRSHLRTLGWFQKANLPEPNLAEHLDLVALGTIADVVPLDHNNRILVHQGLQRIRAGSGCLGIHALIEIAKRDAQSLSTGDLGFALGPRLNAVGRLDDMSLGIECLLSDAWEKAKELAQTLDDLNQDRKDIEHTMQQEAQAILETITTKEENLPCGLVLFEAQWHQGVVGLVASKLKERYYRPVIAFAPSEEAGMLKGSGRSIAGVHLRDVLQDMAKENPSLMAQFGGHAMAVGLSMQQENIDAFRALFTEILAKTLTPEHLTQELLTDGPLQPEHFCLSLARYLKYVEPWGQHFPEPLFEGTFHIHSQRLVGEKHLKLQLLLPQTRTPIDAIAFNIDKNIWPDASIQYIRCAYKLDINVWRGNTTLQLLVDFIQPETASASLLSMQETLA